MQYRDWEGGTDVLAHQLHYARFVDLTPDQMRYLMEDRQRMEEEAKSRKGGGFRLQHITTRSIHMRRNG